MTTDTAPAPAPDQKRSPVPVIIALLVIAGVIFVLGKAFGTDPHAVPFMLQGQPAPAFTMKRLDKEGTFTSAEFRGKPMVINFWATWCTPCKYEQPVLDLASQNYSDVTFVGIVFEDTEDNTRRYLKETGTPYIHLYDPKSTVAVDFGVSGVPETYLIDAKGIIVKKTIIPFNSPAEFDEWIKEGLK